MISHGSWRHDASSSESSTSYAQVTNVVSNTSTTLQARIDVLEMAINTLNTSHQLLKTELAAAIARVEQASEARLAAEQARALAAEASIVANASSLYLTQTTAASTYMTQAAGRSPQPAPSLQRPPWSPPQACLSTSQVKE